MSDNPYQPPGYDPRPRTHAAMPGTSSMVLKNVGIVSTGKVLGCVYTLAGLIIGGILSLASIAGLAAGAREGGGAALFISAGAIVFFPIFYGVIGFIGGMIAALLYNGVAAVVGGIEFEFTSTSGGA